MGLFSSIGGILGGVVGSVIPGVGTAIGATVGAGLGGAAGSAIDANRANKKAKGYYNSQMSFAQQQAQFQMDYAKKVMQWRVADAKKAGVHPMAAFGVSNPSYSPVSAPSAPQIYDAGQFDTGSTFGQSLNRAAMVDKNQAQQVQAARLGFDQINLQNQGLSLDNQYKALQVAQLASELQRNAASSAPAPQINTNNPIGGEDSPFMDKPIIRDGWLLDEKGRKISIIPSDALKGRTEDVLGVEWLPFIGSAYRDAKARLIGHEVNGHWWHGLDKGYLPYPPKPKGKKNVKVSSYYDNSYRY